MSLKQDVWWATKRISLIVTIGAGLLLGFAPSNGENINTSNTNLSTAGDDVFIVGRVDTNLTRVQIINAKKTRTSVQVCRVHARPDEALRCHYYVGPDGTWSMPRKFYTGEPVNIIVMQDGQLAGSMYANVPVDFDTTHIIPSRCEEQPRWLFKQNMLNNTGVTWKENAVIKVKVSTAFGVNPDIRGVKKALDILNESGTLKWEWAGTTEEPVEFDKRQDGADVILGWVDRTDERWKADDEHVAGQAKVSLDWTNPTWYTIDYGWVMFDRNTLQHWGPDKRIVGYLHELGHVAGLAHSTRPDNIMYPWLTRDVPGIDGSAKTGLGGQTDGVCVENPD